MDTFIVRVNNEGQLIRKIYVASRCWNYDGCVILKAFYDENKAKELKKKIESMTYEEKVKTEMWCDYVDVDEVELE